MLSKTPVFPNMNGNLTHSTNQPTTSPPYTGRVICCKIVMNYLQGSRDLLIYSILITLIALSQPYPVSHSEHPRFLPLAVQQTFSIRKCLHKEATLSVKIFYV